MVLILEYFLIAYTERWEQQQNESSALRHCRSLDLHTIEWRSNLFEKCSNPKSVRNFFRKSTAWPDYEYRITKISLLKKKKRRRFAVEKHWMSNKSHIAFDGLQSTLCVYILCFCTRTRWGRRRVSRKEQLIMYILLPGGISFYLFVYWFSLSLSVFFFILTRTCLLGSFRNCRLKKRPSVFFFLFLIISRRSSGTSQNRDWLSGQFNRSVWLSFESYDDVRMQ